MSPEEFEIQLKRVAQIQRGAGWSEDSIRLYAEDRRAALGGHLDSVVLVCAGIGCDNTRFGVSLEPKLVSQRTDGATQARLSKAEELLEKIMEDSGFRNLFEPLQEEISTFLRPDGCRDW